jgi:hypothetical protein
MNRLSVLNRGSEWIAGQKGVHAFFSGLCPAMTKYNPNRLGKTHAFPSG